MKCVKAFHSLEKTETFFVSLIPSTFSSYHITVNRCLFTTLTMPNSDMDMDVDILEVDADSIKIELADAEATDATVHPLPPRSTSTWPTAFTEKLWDYQQEAVKAFWSSLSGGVKRMGFSLPTGAGKTAIFSTITMQMVKNGRQRGRSARVLILVSSGELGRQVKDSLENMDRNEARKVSIGWEQGQERASPSAEV